MATQEPQIRRAKRADVHEIAAMIQELADFEKESDSNKATPDKLLETVNFTDDVSSEHIPATWLASPGVYLEDLYVRPAFRRRGLATLLFGALAEEAQRISEGEGRLEWWCLRWNEGALKFYERIGGTRMEEWVSIRVAGGGKLEHLKQLANEVRAKNSK
ncbi:hypothetical protein PRNP1_005250 [Phytophthora ramorum]